MILSCCGSSIEYATPPMLDAPLRSGSITIGMNLSAAEREGLRSGNAPGTDTPYRVLVSCATCRIEVRSDLVTMLRASKRLEAEGVGSVELRLLRSVVIPAVKRGNTP